MAETLTPGQRIPKKQFQELLAAWHGGQQSTVQVPLPKGLSIEEEESYKQHPVYRQYFADGSYVESRESDNGLDYEIVDYKLSPKAAAAQRQEEPGASRTETVAANPTQEWIGERKPGETEITWTRNKNFKGPETEKPKVITTKHDDKTGITNILVENPDGAREWQQVTGGPTAASNNATASGKDRVPVKGHPGVYEVTEKKKSTTGTETTETNNTYYEDEAGNPVAQPVEERKPEPYTMVEGKPYIRQPDGSLKPAPIEGGPTTADVEMEPGVVLGHFAEAFNRGAAKIDADPTIDVNEKARRIALLGNKFKLLAQESTDVLNAQATGTNQLLTQRGQTLQETQSRRTMAEKMVSGAFDNITKLAPYLPADTPPEFLASALRGDMLIQARAQKAFGGLRESPEPGLAPAQQQVRQQSLPTSSGQQQSAMPAINININGQPSSGLDQAIQQAAQPPQDFTPATPNMNYEGGQLRAPGFRADEDMPAWL